ncbi:MAG: putative ABC transporter permease [Oscillospiraceae bacterium]|nr:putative ABC transporter permease [Oscillospiraceae bacterium]
MSTAVVEKVKTEEKPSVPKKKFAQGLCFYKLFWVFFIACFLGVILETLWVFVTRFELQNRTGLIYGPFNLVYGCGAVIMTICLNWLSGKRDLWIFLAGTFIGGGYEYFCSWIQEKMFGTVSWQYDKMAYNLDGRINLLYCIFWGILALLWVKEIYPRMSRWIEKIPNTYALSLTWVLIVFMIFNTIMSALAVACMAARNQDSATSNAVTAYFDEHYPDERMAKIYPSMVFVSE